jgi:phosphohistidine phosphatase SixA
MWRLAATLAFLASCTVAAAPPVPLSELAKPGHLLMLRHAFAPGNGDPPDFRLEDCSTQRNLDAVGRAQARALGRRLAKAGIRYARVYSSQWCRCLDTARLLGLGEIRELPALNSFYPRPEEREPRLAELRSFLAAQATDGPPLILVTHQFTISGLTEAGTPSGGGSLFRLNGTAHPQLIGSIAPD